jgi:hypothetical protein
MSPGFEDRQKLEFFCDCGKPGGRILEFAARINFCALVVEQAIQPNVV